MTVSEYPIAFAGAEDYAPEIIFPALTRAAEASGFTREMVAGRRVLLKPNLLMKRRPEEATTTHPLVVEAAARLLLDWGASEVTIADSPGGPYTRPLLHSIYETCGMTAAARQSGAGLMRTPALPPCAERKTSWCGNFPSSTRWRRRIWWCRCASSKPTA